MPEEGLDFPYTADRPERSRALVARGRADGLEVLCRLDPAGTAGKGAEALARAERATFRAERAFVQRSTRRRGGPPGAPLHPSLDVGHDTLPQIKHIVVLMMENHSYDNYLGMLPGRGEGFTLRPDGKPTAANPAPDGTRVPAVRRGETTGVHGVPLQTWKASHTQYGGGRGDGFVRSIHDFHPNADPSVLSVPMGYWTQEELPFYYGLAQTFPLVDRWFCSCLGPTFPNRRFLIAGTAHGLIDDLPFGMLDYPPAGTVFDQLTMQGISWANYYNIRHLRLIGTRLLGKPGLQLFRGIGLLLSQLVPAIRNTVIGNLQFTTDLYPLGALGALNHLRSIERFFKDAATGRLPAVSIVDPDFGRYSEESPQDIQDGEGFAAEVINAVMAGKGWPETLLIWTYDEHGGYYDHLSPPAAVAPDDVAGHSLLNLPGAIAWILRRFGLWQKIQRIDEGPTTYERYGFRVPAVIVSPFARKDWVSSRDAPDNVYDHTSILKLIERKWNLPSLTRRDAEALDPLDALDLDGPPAFRTPPTLPQPAKGWQLDRFR